MGQQFAAESWEKKIHVKLALIPKNLDVFKMLLMRSLNEGCVLNVCTTNITN